MKIFPAGRLGSRYVSDIQAPLGKMPLMVVGASAPQMYRSTLRQGIIAGIGSGIFLKEDILNENEEESAVPANMEEKMKSMEEKNHERHCV